jgi:hypothetical protein
MHFHLLILNISYVNFESLACFYCHIYSSLKLLVHIYERVHFTQKECFFYRMILHFTGSTIVVLILRARNGRSCRELAAPSHRCKKVVQAHYAAKCPMQDASFPSNPTRGVGDKQCDINSTRFGADTLTNQLPLPGPNKSKTYV